MMNEKKLRLIVFVVTVVLHLVFLLFFVIYVDSSAGNEIQTARIMKLTDFNEISPPLPEDKVDVIDEIAVIIDEIAENLIETDIPQVEHTIAFSSVNSFDNYLAMHQLSSPPQFDENAIISALAYPQIALRSGIEGRVFLELYVDYTGIVQRVVILREDPEGWGFGEAAVRVFTGRKGTPALSNGEPVYARFRYPVTFRIK